MTRAQDYLSESTPATIAATMPLKVPPTLPNPFIARRHAPLGNTFLNWADDDPVEENADVIEDSELHSVTPQWRHTFNQCRPGSLHIITNEDEDPFRHAPLARLSFDVDEQADIQRYSFEQNDFAQMGHLDQISVERDLPKLERELPASPTLLRNLDRISAPINKKKLRSTGAKREEPFNLQCGTTGIERNSFGKDSSMESQKKLRSTGAKREEPFNLQCGTTGIERNSFGKDSVMESRCKIPTFDDLDMYCDWTACNQKPTSLDYDNGTDDQDYLNCHFNQGCTYRTFNTFDSFDSFANDGEVADGEVDGLARSNLAARHGSDSKTQGPPLSPSGPRVQSSAQSAPKLQNNGACARYLIDQPIPEEAPKKFANQVLTESSQDLPHSKRSPKHVAKSINAQERFHEDPQCEMITRVQRFAANQTHQQISSISRQSQPVPLSSTPAQVHREGDHRREEPPMTTTNQICVPSAPPLLQAPSSLQQANLMSLLAKCQVETPITTLMIRNIPTWYTQDMLLNEWPNNNTYDLLYLPFCFRTKRNLAFAFVNFMTPEDAIAFRNRWHKQRLQQHTSRKPLDISDADVQGRFDTLQKLTKHKSCRIKNVHFQPAIFANRSRYSIDEYLSTIRSMVETVTLGADIHDETLNTIRRLMDRTLSRVSMAAPTV
jgi:hypothetical protein